MSNYSIHSLKIIEWLVHSIFLKGSLIYSLIITQVFVHLRTHSIDIAQEIFYTPIHLHVNHWHIINGTIFSWIYRGMEIAEMWTYCYKGNATSLRWN